MPGDDLVDTLEMYLKAVLELEEEGVVPMRARLAERFDHLTSTVSGTVQRLQRDGLVQLDPKRRLVLTEQGREIAEAVIHKHRLAEVFLDRVLGLDWELIHNEACRWEHVISDRVVVLFDKLLGHPKRTPYGNLIEGAWGRDARGAAVEADSEDSADAGVEVVDSLARLLAEGNGRAHARIEWIGERLQADPKALLVLRQHGLVPGTVLHASVRGGSEQGDQVLVACLKDKKGETKKVSSVAGGTEIPLTLAAHLFARTCVEGVGKNRASQAVPGLPSDGSHRS